MTATWPRYTSWRDYRATQRLRDRLRGNQRPPDRTSLYFLVAVLLVCSGAIFAIKCVQQDKWLTDGQFDRRLGR